MQRKISKILFLAAIGTLLIVAGCSKSGGSTVAKTKTDFLVSSTWKFNSAGIDQDGNGTIDVSLPAGTLETCVTDNTITFKSDNSGVIDEGATKCDASAAQTAPFTWTLNSKDTLTLSTPILTGFGNSAKVLSITDSTFVLTQSLTVSSFPVPLPIVVILKH